MICENAAEELLLFRSLLLCGISRRASAAVRELVALFSFAAVKRVQQQV